MNIANHSTISVGGSQRLYSYVSGSDDEVDVIDDSSGLSRVTPSSGSRRMHGAGRSTYGDPSRPVVTGLNWRPSDGTPRDVPPPAEPDDDDDDDDDASDVSSPSWVRSESEDENEDGRVRNPRHGRGIGGGAARNVGGQADLVEDGGRRGFKGNCYSNINCNATLPLPSLPPPPAVDDDLPMIGGGAAPAVPPRRQPLQHQQHSLQGGAPLGSAARMYGSGTQTCDRIRSTNNNKNGDIVGVTAKGGVRDWSQQYHHHHHHLHPHQQQQQQQPEPASSRTDTTSFIVQPAPIRPLPLGGTSVVSSVAPTFPRTVPRVSTLQRNSRNSVNDLDNQQQSTTVQTQQSLQQQQQLAAAPTSDVTDCGQQSSATGYSQRLQSVPNVTGPGHQTTPIPLWRRQDHEGPPAGYNAKRQNTSFNANSMLLSLSNPNNSSSSQSNDFRNQSRFHTTGRRMRKQLQGRCSWRCTASLLACLTVALLAIVSYLIAMKVHNLTWRLEQTTLKSYRQSLADDTENRDGLSAIPVSLGAPMSADLAPHSFWPLHFYLPDPRFVKFNVSLPAIGGALVGLYGRRNVRPTHTRHDFFHAFDADAMALTYAGLDRRRLVRAATSHTNLSRVDSAFIQYLDTGVWYIYIYNDDDQTHHVTFVASMQDQSDNECPQGCHGRGDCISGQCQCFPGFSGWDCKQSICPMLCQGNGIYSGGECKCYSGWKGKECNVPVSQCEDPNCGGNGKCIRGYCVCAPGYKGTNCLELDCVRPNCSGHGLCVNGRCRCFSGHAGSDCRLTSAPARCSRNCTGFELQLQSCGCVEPPRNDTEHHHEQCSIDCLRGRCEQQRCRCDEGWSGAACDQISCDRRCTEHGFCNNGTCTCKQGWNGRHCSLAGCRNGCHNHGMCDLFLDTWKCNCQPGWKGTSCEIAKEIDCDNEIDDDKDGLVDCIDPDCCISAPCKENAHCQSAPDPMEILLRKQPPSSSAPFYERMRFLIEDDSLQNYVTLSSFNQSQVSVIRGKVIQADGTPLIGVRVGVATQPLYGFTLTRDSGVFDILVNGGGSMTLNFIRHPFQQKQTTLMVPWNRLVMLDVVTMVLEGEHEPVVETCPQVSHDHYVMRPVVLSTWQHTQLGSCPEQSTVIPESQVLQESLPIPSTNIFLVYRSSQTSGYMSTIVIQLTPDNLPSELVVVHLRVVVEGLVFRYTFEAEANLRYRFTWDRRNAYNQKVYGIVTASVGVGYEYTGCGRVFWETQSTTMNSFDITPSEIGGWNLHIHHTYNFQEGILYKGDGTNVYLKERPRRVVTILGDGKARRVDCRGCDGRVEDARLMAPVALASGRDGSLYVGDYNHVRKLAASRDEIASIMQLSVTEIPYKYFLTVSPLDGKLYISDHQTLRILRVKTMGPVRDLAQNYEVVAGTGEQCIPGDRERCGDNGLATAARLFYPKGIAIDKDGIIYFADGANIRTIAENGTIRTLIGSQGHPKYFDPLPCYKVVSTDEVTLNWPLSLAIDPIDNSLHILDNNVVLKVTADNKVIVVAGRLLHCPPRGPDAGLLNSDPDAAVELETNSAGPAADAVLESPQHIAFANDGVLYVVESNRRNVNRVRAVGTDGLIRLYAGSRRTSCDCDGSSGTASKSASAGGCQCFDAGEQLATRMQLDTPTAVTVTPDGVVHVADMGNLRVHSVLPPTPNADRSGGFEVLYPQTSELYAFNRFGHHVATRDIVTGQTKYNFTYSVNSYYGRLLKVTDSAGSSLSISRDYKMAAKELLTPGGPRCSITMDSMGQLASFVGADNLTTRFNYIGNSGLIESKENGIGQTFIYEYDNYGRLTYVIQPTGSRVSVDNESNIGSKSSNEIRVSYPHDSYLAIEYPFKMAVTMETIPHPLLSTDRPLSVRRRIIQPDNRTHVAVWRYYGRGDVRTARRLEADRGVRSSGKHLAITSGFSLGGSSGSKPSGVVDSQDTTGDEAATGRLLGYKGKELLVNGESLLSFEYDAADNSQTVYDSQRNELLVVRHDAAGRILQVVPRGPLDSLNVTYDRQGRWIQWSRGDLTVSRLFDTKTGRVMERRLAPRSIYRYTYKNGTRPVQVDLPSGNHYQLTYDDAGGLRLITTPTGAHHHFHVVTLIGRQRVIYRAPGSTGVYIRDFDGAGRLIDERYPSDHRRVAYRYDKRGRLAAIYHDWIDVTLAYDDATIADIASNVTVVSRAGEPFEHFIRYERESSLVVSQEIRLVAGPPGVVHGVFRYSYGANFQLASVEATIGGHPLPAEIHGFDSSTGSHVQVAPFTFERPHLQRHVTRDLNVEIVREFDARGRPTDVWYRFNNHVVFTVETKYDATGRVHQWRRKVRSSDLKAYERVYDVDGQLVEVLENGQSTWRYDMDVDGNLIRVAYYTRPKSIALNQRGAVESVGDTSYLYDADGFQTRRADSETFEYDSLGRLTRVHRSSSPSGAADGGVGRYDVRYQYDGLGRLAVRHETVSGSGATTMTQYFYADLVARRRITHVYHVAASGNGAAGTSGGERGTVIRYFYDGRGKLFAMQRFVTGSDLDELFYVGLDPFNSPIVVLNGVGSVVKQLTYDPLGACTSDTAPDFALLIFGFRGAINDPTVRLVLTVDGLAYDPAVGRWTSARYGRVLNNVDGLSTSPELVGLLYRNDVRSWRYSPMTDIGRWLPLLGFNYGALVPDVTYFGVIGSSPVSTSSTCSSPAPGDVSTQSPMSVTSAFRCAFDRDTRQFSRLSLVSPSVVTDSDRVTDFESDDLVSSEASTADSMIGRSVAASTGGLSVTPYIFGAGVVLDVNQTSGEVTVVTLDSAHQSVAFLVAVLLNGSIAVHPRVAGSRGRDVLHFVRPSLNDSNDDIQRLNLRAEGTVRGLNVTVHRVHEAPSGGSQRYVDVRIHGEHATVNIRYGATVLSEHSRLLHHAWQRAVDAAWVVERELLQAGKLSANVWSRAQTEELVDRGRVDGYTGQYIRDVTTPSNVDWTVDGRGGLVDLADWPRNIRFVHSVR